MALIPPDLPCIAIRLEKIAKNSPCIILTLISIGRNLVSDWTVNSTHAGPGHFEDRTVSAGCNPYLALAAYISAGLDGIRKQLDPGPPNMGNMYETTPEEIRQRGIRLLPQTLSEALGALETDPVVLESLGAIGEDFIALKKEEWGEYNRQVGSWEIERYLTLF